MVMKYALFQAHNTIHARVVPNFAEELIFDTDDFLRKAGVKGEGPPGSGGRSNPVLGGPKSLPSGG